MSLNDYKWRIAFKALALAFISYIIIFVLYSIVEVTDKKSKFAYATEFLDKQKQRLVYTSLFVNTVFYIDEDTLNGIYTDSDKYGLEARIYPLSGAVSSYEGKEKIVADSIIYAIGNMNLFVENSKYLIYFRSYEKDGKLISFNDLGDFTANENMFSKEKCQKYNLCSTYASSESLSDRLLVSNIYIDPIVGAKTITLSSPVIDSGEVIGDISIDIYFKLSILADKASIYTQTQGGMTYIYVDYPNYPLSELSFLSSYVIDNKSTLVFKLPVSKLILDTTPMFLLALVISLLATIHYMRFKIQKKMFYRVREESSRDEMTGLYNRKVLSTQEFLADTSNRTVAILAIDGDKLKKINDTCGHHCGDAAIQHISNVMRGVFRDSDYLVRTGGDEFLAILPGCPPPLAMELKDQLKTEVSRNKIRPYNLQVSISVGIAVKRPDDDMNQALIAADENLYQDKSTLSKEVPV